MVKRAPGGAVAGAMMGAGHSPARQSILPSARPGAGEAEEAFFSCVCPAEMSSTPKR